MWVVEVGPAMSEAPPTTFYLVGRPAAVAGDTAPEIGLTGLSAPWHPYVGLFGLSFVGLPLFCYLWYVFLLSSGGFRSLYGVRNVMIFLQVPLAIIFPNVGTFQFGLVVVRFFTSRSRIDFFGSNYSIYGMED